MERLDNNTLIVATIATAFVVGVIVNNQNDVKEQPTSHVTHQVKK